MKHVLPLLIMLLVVIIVLSLIPSMAVNKVELSPGIEDDELPDITYGVEPLPTDNIGPGKPAIVSPGASFTIEFKQELSPEITNGYIYTVVLENDKLVVHNYTVTISGSGTVYSVTIPSNTMPGLYDLVLIGDDEYFIPRSVWVIGSINDVFTFMHISDLHYGAGTPDEDIGRNRRFSGLLLANMLSPMIVFNTGDEADTASTRQYVESRAFRYSFLYNIPVFLTAGNHDYPNSNFEEYYGETVWYRVIGNKILVIVVNTRDIGYLSWDQLKFVEEVLSNHYDIPVKIILMHHPLFWHQGLINTSYDNPILISDPHSNNQSILSYYWAENISAARYFLKIVEDYNVSLVLTGHIHRDQYNIYYSNRTQTITYFITTTTLAHGTGIYQGLQYVKLHINNRSLVFPYAPESFIGFNDSAPEKVYNSIPNTLPNLSPNWNYTISGNQYYYGEYLKARSAYIFTLYNNFTKLRINKTIILNFPWKGDIVGLQVLNYTGTAMAELKDALKIGDRMFLAVHLVLMPGSKLRFAIYNKPDLEPPTIIYKMSIPRIPILGRTVKLIFEIKDDAWGVNEETVSAKAIVGGYEFNMHIYRYGGDYYKIETKFLGDKPRNVTFIIHAEDYAGHSTDAVFNITFYPQQPKTTTTTTTTTTTISTSTTTTTTSTLITSTTTSSTTTTSTTTRSTTTSTTGEKTITSESEGMNNYNILLAALIIIVLLIAILLFFKRGS